MRFWNDLFGNRDKVRSGNGSTVTEVQDPVPSFTVDRDLFIESEAPAGLGSSGPSRLKHLAGQDHSEAGYQAGYAYHDMEVGRQLAERIKAELARALDDELDNLGFLVGELDVQLERLSGEDDMRTTYRALLSKKTMIERHQMKIREQQLLVAGNTGYAELPIASFNAGFTRGYTVYLEESLLLNKYQG